MPDRRAPAPARAGRAGGGRGPARRAGGGLRRPVVAHRGEGVRRRGGVAVVGRHRGHRRAGGRRRPPGLRLRRLARRRRRGRGAGRGPRQRRLRHGRRVPRPGRARRRRPRPTSTCSGRSWPPSPPTARWSWPSRSTGPPGPPTPASGGWRAPATATRRRSRPSRPPRASGSPAGGRTARCGPRPWPARARRPRPATATRSAAHPEDLDLAKAAADAADRATRLLGARKPASRRLTVVLRPQGHGLVPGRAVVDAVGAESAIKGRSLFAGREGEAVAVPLLTLVDDPTEPEAYGAVPLRRRGPGQPAQRPHRGRRAGRLPAQLLHRPALGPGVERGRGAGRLHDRARRRQPGPDPHAGRPHPGRAAGRRRATACSCSRSAACTRAPTR